MALEHLTERQRLRKLTISFVKKKPEQFRRDIKALIELSNKNDDVAAEDFDVPFWTEWLEAWGQSNGCNTDL